jgi:hypothetical protein
LNFSIFLACLGAGISLYGISQYLQGILHHGTQPRMASWVAWLTANVIFAITALHMGAYLAATIDGIAALTNAAVIAVSVRQRVDVKPGDITDWSCLMLSIICIVVITIIPQEKTMIAALAMVANLTATIPTFRHAWTRPKEETWQLFAANGFAGGLGFIGVLLASGFSIVSLAGPLMAMAGNLGLVAITVGRGWVTRIEEEFVEDVHTAERMLVQVSDDESDTSG